MQKIGDQFSVRYKIMYSIYFISNKNIFFGFQFIIGSLQEPNNKIKLYIILIMYITN